jgi:RND superfamily putative drug exporter
LYPLVTDGLGKHTWYLPRWLGRILPRISIEGTEYFQARDQLPVASQTQDPASGAAPLVNAKDS